MQACNLYGCSGWSLTLALALALVTVAIPTDLPMTVPGHFQVRGAILGANLKFTWDPVEGAVMYRIKQELFSCGGQAPTYLDVGASASQPFTQRATLGICNGQAQDPSTWHFSIQACADVNAVRCSEWSPTESVMVGSTAGRTTSGTTAYV